MKKGLYMKKLLTTALITLSALSLNANETRLLPILSDNYCPAPTIALVGGYGEYSDISYSSSAMYGVELGFGCPVFEVKDLEINQVLSLVHYSENGLTTNSLEMNPRIMFNLNDKTKFGFGPGLGVLFTSNGSTSDTVFGVQVGASLNYQINSDVFIGIETRYQWAGDASLANGTTKVDMDNHRTLLKVGTHF